MFFCLSVRVCICTCARMSRVTACSQGSICCWPRPLQLLWGVVPLQEVQVRGGEVHTVAEWRKVLEQSGTFELDFIFLPEFWCQKQGSTYCWVTKRCIYFILNHIINPPVIALVKGLIQHFAKYTAWFQFHLPLCRRTLFRDSSILSHPVGEGAPAFGHKKSSNLSGKDTNILLISPSSPGDFTHQLFDLLICPTYQQGQRLQQLTEALTLLCANWVKSEHTDTLRSWRLIRLYDESKCQNAMKRETSALSAFPTTPIPKKFGRFVKDE